MDAATNYFFAPSAGRWNLTSEQFEEGFRRMWPDATVEIERSETVPSQASFWLVDPHLHGFYSPVGRYVRHENFTCQKVAPAEIAEVVACFLTLLPPDAEVKFNSELGVEEGFADRDWSLDRNATTDEVMEALRAHLRDVGAEEY